MTYDYRCPRCDSREITLREITGDKIIFHCGFCGEDFVVRDQEEGFLPQKVESLRKRYPLEGVERSGKKRLAHRRRNFNQLRY